LGNRCEVGAKAVVVVSLKDARDACTDAPPGAQTGTGPVQRREADTAAKTRFAATIFKTVALEYQALKVAAPSLPCLAVCDRSDL